MKDGNLKQNRRQLRAVAIALGSRTEPAEEAIAAVQSLLEKHQYVLQKPLPKKAKDKSKV